MSLKQHEPKLTNPYPVMKVKRLSNVPDSTSIIYFTIEKYEDLFALHVERKSLSEIGIIVRWFFPDLSKSQADLYVLFLDAIKYRGSTNFHVKLPLMEVSIYKSYKSTYNNTCKLLDLDLITRSMTENHFFVNPFPVIGNVSLDFRHI